MTEAPLLARAAPSDMNPGENGKMRVNYSSSGS
jgi:hypothetical protein